MSGNGDQEAITGVEGELRSYGISVESIDHVREGLEVTYMTAFPGESVNHREMGRACNALIDMAKADEWEPEPVEATAVRGDDSVIGTWRIDPEWVEGLLAGDLSEVEFSTKVVDSVEER